MDKVKLKNVVEAILMASDRVLTLVQIEKMLTEKKTVSKKDNVEDAVKALEALAANDDANASSSSNSSESDTTVSSDNEEQVEAEAAVEEASDKSSEKAEPKESANLKTLLKEVIENLQQDYTDRAMELKEVASGFRFQVRQEYADHVGKLWEERPSKYSRALLETLVLIAYRQPITRGEIEAIRGVSVSSHIVKTLVEREWVRVIGHRDVPGKPAIFGSTKEFLDYFNLKSLDELPSLAEIKDLDKIAPELALEEAIEKVAANTPDEAAGDEQETSESNETTELDGSDEHSDNSESETEVVAEDSEVAEVTADESEASPDVVDETEVVDDLDNKIEETDQTDSDVVTTSQENESDNTELS